MNGITLFVLLGAAAGMTAAPVAFADHATAEVTNAEGSSWPGCEITNECFIPHVVTIDVGGEVKWTNSDLTAHTVTSGVSAEGGADGEFDSGLFLPGTEFSHVFEEAGRYPYFCLVHPWMQGLIMVQGTAGDDGGADPVMGDAEYRFITTWETTDHGDSITIPVGGAAGSYTVDWGDGAVTVHERDARHTYDTPGKYTVQISGDFTRIILGDDPHGASMLRSVDQWGAIKWATMESAFEGAVNMVYAATDAPDLSRVNDMSSMFENAISFNGDISTWNTSSVTDMSWMFWNATSFNQPLDTWDVSSVTDMSFLFYDAASFNQDISPWNVSSVTDMGGMFWGASSFNQPLDNWNVSSTIFMNSMFKDAASFNQPLDSWDVSSVTNMAGMFSNATSFNQDISAWNVSSTIFMNSMFKDAASFNQPLDRWDVSSVTNMVDMFRGAAAFNQPLDSWDVSSVTYMIGMFRGAAAFNGDISSWDVSLVTDMGSMFLEAASFNQPLNNWDVSSVTYMSWMLSGAASFNQPLNNWDVSSVIFMDSMFEGAASFNQPLDTWDVSSVPVLSPGYGMDRMFYNATSFDQNLGGWYVVMDSASIDREDVPGMVGTISAQNPFLDNQNTTYRIEPGGDSHLFEITGGNILRMVSVAADRTTYAVTIAASGDSVFEDGNNRRTVQVILAE